MMPSQTPNLDIPHMVDGDPLADVATIMQALAERLDGGGWTAFTPDPATGFAITGAEYWVFGPLVCLRMTVTNNTGAAITMSANGNVADQTVGDPGCIPAAICPSGGTNDAAYHLRFVSSGVATYFGRVATDGSLLVTHGQPNASWANGAALTLADMYLMTSPPVVGV